MKAIGTLTTLCIAVVIVMSVIGCASQPSLTKEELQLRKLYHREVAEDKDYVVRPAGFSARPVQEPFASTLMRRVGTDGIEFICEGHMMDRDPRFYAGKLSAYFSGTGMYDSSGSAVSNLELLVQHTQSPHTIISGRDSTFQLGENTVREFHWLLVHGGSVPLNNFQLDAGMSPDAEVVGAIVQTEKGSYLVYLLENKLYTFRSKGPAICADGWDNISAEQANNMMEQRFQQFLHGIRFDID